VAVLVLKQWRVLWQGLLPAFGLSLLAPLTYLYLPLRVWQGATWTFGAPGTVQRMMLMLLDNRAERIVSWPEGISEWAVRIERAFAVTATDIPLPLLALGLLGLLVIPMVERRWREAAGLTLAWIPYILLTGAIWIGEVGDAQLAAHLPVTILAAAGLALLADRLARRGHWGQIGATVALAVTLFALTILHRPAILEVTHDPSAEQIIALAEQVSPPPDGRPTALMALWGNDYWALAYTQAFEGRLPGLAVVDHNADFNAILADGYRLLTFSKTFYLRPLSWWQQYLGVKKVHLSSVAPEIIEIALKPTIRPADVPPGPELDLGNNLWIRSAQLSWAENGDLVLTVYWQAKKRSKENYSVAVHLVARDPPQGPEDILSQTDYHHPMYGHYPISRWRAREIVRDHYQLAVPQPTAPQAVRIALYRTDASGTFLNTPWLSLPLPDR
jgi:hypothetical protein